VFIFSFIVSKVTVTSRSFYIKCSMCPPCCWTTHTQNVFQNDISLSRPSLRPFMF